MLIRLFVDSEHFSDSHHYVYARTLAAERGLKLLLNMILGCTALIKSCTAVALGRRLWATYQKMNSNSLANVDDATYQKTELESFSECNHGRWRVMIDILLVTNYKEKTITCEDINYCSAGNMELELFGFLVPAVVSNA